MVKIQEEKRETIKSKVLATFVSEETMRDVKKLKESVIPDTAFFCFYNV